MKQTKYLGVLIFLASILFIGCKNSSNSKLTSPEKTELTDSEDDWVSIWNGKDLTGWNTYFNSPFSGFDQTQEGYLGLNNPKQDVIKVVQLEDGNVIRISGTAFGMMSTEQDYGNYHLKLKVKWGKDKHVPKENDPMDSGLMYHGFGEPGSSYAWMNSHEMQIQEGYAGDWVAIGDIQMDVPSKPLDRIFYQYDENSSLRTYYSAKLFKDDRQTEYVKEGLMDSLAKMNVMKYPDKENKHGAWNEIDLICFGDSSIHMVNSTVVMRLFNSKKTSDKSPVRAGKIGLQSEGAEVFYKDIRLKKINKMPVNL
tara:strand:+ start:1618 stop:2547 length:930 start_codon:yes stop_codon:yes gene_type:complete